VVRAYVDPIDPSRMIVSFVRFTLGARTNWHSHAVGQTLLAIGGDANGAGQQHFRALSDRFGSEIVVGPVLQDADLENGSRHPLGSGRHGHLAGLPARTNDREGSPVV
jgi:hypothetical protein